jgi:HK97 family phage major capsid protein
MPDKLEQLEQAFAAKQARAAKAFEEAGPELDFSKESVRVILDNAADSAAAVAKLQEWNTELEVDGKELDEARSLVKMRDGLKRAETEPVNAPPIPGGDGTPKRKTLGQLITASRPFKDSLATGSPAKGIVEGFGFQDLKTLFQTSAGWAPESTRVPGLVIDAVTRPIQLMDLIPPGSTEQAAVVYMEETTRTHASAERAENAAYAESQFALTERSSTVRSIGTSIPVTDEQLQDVAGVQSYLEGRLVFGNRQRFDSQVLNGDGSAPNLEGILNKSGIQTQAKGGDTVPDAIYKAMTLVRVTGRAFPNAVVLHPNDWQGVRLLRTADGIYIWGSPSEAGPERIWGVRVVQSDAITENTGLVGDFLNFCQMFERRGMEVLVGYVDDDFLDGRQTIRAGFRVAFVIYRAAAFCTVTSI